jgi:hypothetical protein
VILPRKSLQAGRCSQLRSGADAIPYCMIISLPK